MKGSSTQETQCVRQCWDFLVSRKAGPVKLAERNQRLLCAIADAQQWLSDTEVVDGMKHIAAEIEVSLCDSEAREILQLLRKLGQHPESTHSSNSSNLTELRTDKIEKMKVGEVKQLLAAEGLSTEGIKKVLIKRLIAARDAALLKTINSRPPQDRGLIDHGSSIILVLSHQLQQFPWEGMDIMTSSGGVTRMPSLDLILQHTISPALTLPIIRRDRIRYLLNPAGDLKSTQNQLRPILEGGVATYGWDGVIGEAPDPDKLSCASDALGRHGSRHRPIERQGSAGMASGRGRRLESVAGAGVAGLAECVQAQIPERPRRRVLWPPAARGKELSSMFKALRPSTTSTWGVSVMLLLLAKTVVDEDNATFIARIGAHPLLMRLMEHENEDIQEAAAEVVTSCTSSPSAITFPHRVRQVGEVERLWPRGVPLPFDTRDNAPKNEDGTQGTLEVLIRQVPTRMTGQRKTGYLLWGAAFVLARWIHMHRELFEGKSVIEVGSGLGLGGIVAARYATHTTLTDYQSDTCTALDRK
ncbi:hypothetical protein ON010_g16974 [Phytophthora cinnamomi]|nr:hypothetical protein ON010_g16974 [Phytophthora cinnamomi]